MLRRTKIFSMLGILAASLFAAFTLDKNTANAVTYASDVGVSFTFNTTLSVSLSTADLIITNLAPGTLSDSNIIAVNAGTNNVSGYTMNATVGNSTTYNTRNLIHTNATITSNFASIDYGSTLSALTTDNTWGYSYSTDGQTTWSTYSGLPLYSDTTNITTLKTTTAPSSDVVNFKIAAKAATTQDAGEYRNVINFATVANPAPTVQPISCAANKICYSSNSLDVSTNMDDESATSNSTAVLWAPNFVRSGYGFAGWSTELTDHDLGPKYGPNETIYTDDLSTEGIPLYAMWVASAGNMQSWSGCSAMNVEDVTALTDTRDGSTYAIAKLEDGKCWMIENLRLDDTPELTTANTNSPSLPLNNTWWTDSSTYTTLTTSNYLSATSSTWCSVNTADCHNQSMLNTTNTASSVSTMSSANASVKGYGNYYNWYSATAGNGLYSTNTANATAAGSICPLGWHLPIGGDKANESSNEVWDLVVTNLNSGVSPSNYSSETYPYFTGSTEGADASDLVRAWPNNFTYSGYWNASSTSNRGSSGYYWLATANGSNSAYYLGLNTSYVYPGTAAGSKYFGRTVRCVAN